MMDHTIEYKSMIMRCDKVDKNAFLELSSDVEMIFYKKGMEIVWAQVQKSAGEFLELSVEDISLYFMKKFGPEMQELERRCIFLMNKENREYFGTCMAWFWERQSVKVPVLHWLAVSDAYSGKGYARMLITQVMHIFEKYNLGQPVYLHTQPASFRAVKLYNDFGFCLTRTDTYGTSVNEYEMALPVIRKYVPEDVYAKLVETSVF